MDSEAAEAVLEAAGVEELLRAGAASATVGALGELRKGAVAYIGAVAAAAKRLSEGSHRDGGNLRDAHVALERLGATAPDLAAFLRTEPCRGTAGLTEEAEPAEPPAFVSIFATPVKQPAHIDRKRFGPLPPPHQWKDDPPPPAKPGDYVEMRKALGREREEMQTAMINLHIRQRGGIQVEGFPHLQILRHTASAPYLKHFS